MVIRIEYVFAFAFSLVTLMMSNMQMMWIGEVSGRGRTERVSSGKSTATLRLDIVKHFGLRLSIHPPRGHPPPTGHPPPAASCDSHPPLLPTSLPPPVSPYLLQVLGHVTSASFPLLLLLLYLLSPPFLSFHHFPPLFPFSQYPSVARVAQPRPAAPPPVTRTSFNFNSTIH